MASRDFALLCRAATEDGPLFSMLGAGITSVTLPQLPGLLTLTFVARFYWEQAETGQPQVVAVRVEHEDGERIVSLDNGVTPMPTTPEQPIEARAQQIILGLTMDMRRAGSYFARIYVNGDVIDEVPLRVETALPPV